MTTRRALLITLGRVALAVPLAAFAQAQQPRVARMGLLETDAVSAARRAALIAGLSEHGLVEGRNIVIEYRRAEGKFERLPGFAAELVQMKVDVIVAASSPAIRAAQQATSTIPIVMVRTSDPVGMGFVSSLARPGRNITGLSSMHVEVLGKYVELLRVAIPQLSFVTVLANPRNPSHAGFAKRIEAAGKTNGVKIAALQAGTSSEIDNAFESIRRARPQALIVIPDALYGAHATRIAALAVQQRLPMLFGTRETVEAGALMAYGQDLSEHYYRAATYVDKILKGAKPGDLPVEQARKIELVINLKTARAIGLAIPQELLLRADKVFE